ncbi:hypothetical protein KP509_17G063500 [Ceratopteris richardii]|uniref:Uncharacterized protein n=1 Tax=Ceratopteris richardii TaxID=49495 RepID=A0A8T2SYY1_CERRI|nr:hypothetical protein KP509_17G063500 [Ceratopteris richardii]
MGLDYNCSDGGTWEQQLAAYGSLVRALGKPKLHDLDHFYTSSLPSLLRQRRPSPFISSEELVKVVEWKLSRGKWRPKLLSYASSLSEEEVKKASMAAFSAIPDLKAAINALTTLKGVGPATASAILAAGAPDVAPFMSDEAMEAVLGGVKEYTLKQYLLFADRLQCKAKELSKAGGKQFGPSDLERALWCAAMEKRSVKNKEGGKFELTEIEEKKAKQNKDAEKSSARKRRKRD